MLYLEEVAKHADGLRQVKRLHPGGMHCLLQTVPRRYKDSGTGGPLAAGQRLTGDLRMAIIITTRRSCKTLWHRNRSNFRKQPAAHLAGR